MLNQIVLEGIVATAPKLVEFNAERALLDFRIGSPRTWWDAAAQQERTEWVHLDAKVTSAKRARALAEIVRQGMRLTVRGEYRETHREIEGQKRTFVYVHVEDVSLPAKPQPQQAPQEAAPKAKPKVTTLGGRKGAQPEITAAHPEPRSSPDAEALAALGVELSE